MIRIDLTPTGPLTQERKHEETPTHHVTSHPVIVLCVNRTSCVSGFRGRSEQHRHQRAQAEPGRRHDPHCGRRGVPCVPGQTL